jgi:hypothetical protein
MPRIRPAAARPLAASRGRTGTTGSDKGNPRPAWQGQARGIDGASTRMSRPIALTDDQMSALLAAAHPLPPVSRSAFLEACAVELAKLPMIGDGVVHRVAMLVQRQYFDAPDLSHEHAPRWSSRRRNGVRASA